MIILGLGYITIKSDKLDDWTEFSSAYLGMQLVDKTSSTAVLRMDERKQRFVVTNETAASNIFGWEVNDRQSLDILSVNNPICISVDPTSLLCVAKDLIVSFFFCIIYFYFFYNFLDLFSVFKRVIFDKCEFRKKLNV